MTNAVDTLLVGTLFYFLTDVGVADNKQATKLYYHAIMDTKPANDNAGCIIRDGVEYWEGKNFVRARNIRETLNIIHAEVKRLALALGVSIKAKRCFKPWRPSIELTVTYTKVQWTDTVALQASFEALLKSYNSNEKSTYERIEYTFHSEVYLQAE